MFLSERRDFPLETCLAWKKKKTWQLASRCCWNSARPWHDFELVSFLVGLRTYQHPGIWKLCSGVKLHSTQVTGPCLYQSGVPEDPTAIWCIPSRWHLVRRNALKYLNNKCNLAYRLRAGRSGDRIPVGERFSAPIQTGRGVHKAGTGSFLGVKRPGRDVDHPLPSSVKIRERVELYSTPPLALRGLF